MGDKPEPMLEMPAALTVEKGQKYLWCSCGETKTPPLCDKPHCGDKALCYLADLTEQVYFCNCKLTKNPPWCDGSHSKIMLEMARKKDSNF